MNRSETAHSAVSAPRNTRRGLVQNWSRTLIPTAKEAPSEAESISHKLLARGGFIRRVSAGVYSYLPLGWRVLNKVADIVRDEMNAAGASELLMPALAPVDLLKETGRAEDYGDLLFRFLDRHQRDTYLGPTHEEVITDLMRSSITSYRQMPLNLYQIQTKFRDEFRPRAGLLRGREFVMKDAYSFHMSVDGPGGLGEAYDAMYRAYENIFRRCGLDFTVVEAEAGPIGGSASHEFMVNTESGEDTILVCPQTGYAANVEKCEIGLRQQPSKGYFNGDPLGELEEVHTPDCPGIEDVCKLLKTKARNMLKTVVFHMPEHERWVVAVVRGDHEVNEGKVRDLAGGRVELADVAEATKAGFAIGYVSPRAVLGMKDVVLLIDRDAAVGFDDDAGKSMYWVTGGDKKDHHVKKFNWRRDMGSALDDERRVRVADVRNALAGDPSPRAEGVRLEAKRGIEVGHIFKLGTKYSKAMGFEVMDEKQERRPVIMGCYGIGVSRTVASCVEMSHDEDGIVWPASIAPFHVIITPMDVAAASKAMVTAQKLAELLAREGVDVLIDDREERPGVKFKDADLIGIPVRLTIGDKSLAEGSVEFKARRDKGKGELVKIEDAAARCVEALG